MKAIFCAVWLMVLGSGCAYFKWNESDRPWSESSPQDESTSRRLQHSDRMDLPGDRAYK